MIPDLDSEALSSLYNNGLAVADYPQYLARWQARSQELRDRTRYHADLVYGPQPRNRIDLFPPQKMPAPWPLLIFLHGGYWQYLDKRDWSCVAEPYMERGMAVAIVGYTLCPETSVAGIVAEVEAACALLYLHAHTYGLDRRQFHVAGHSAGGHLTAMMLAADWAKRDARLPAKLFRGGVAVSGVFDLEPLTLTPLNVALRLTREEALAVSPICKTNATGAPLLVAVGELETPEFLRQSKTFCAAWPDTTYLEAPGYNHFSVIDAFCNPASQLFAEVWKRFHTEEVTS